MSPLRPALLLLALMLAPLAEADDVLTTSVGVLRVPEGFTQLDGQDAPDEAGYPSGLFVYGRSADALPRAIYIVTYVHPTPEAGAPLAGTDKAAALMANPMDPSPNLRKARPAKIGEAAGHRYSTTLDNGLTSTVYVVDYQGMRMIALLKHPPGGDYKRDTARFEQALEAFDWVDAVPVAPVPDGDAVPEAAQDAGAGDAASGSAPAEATGEAAPGTASDDGAPEGAAPAPDAR